MRALIRVFRQSQLRLREVAILTAVSTALACFEGVGLGMLLPILQYVEEPGAAPSGGIWGLLVDAGSAVGIPITLFSLLLLAFIPVIFRQAFFYANVRYGAVVRARTVNRLRVKGFSALVNSDLEHVERVGVAEAVTTLHQHAGQAGQAIASFLAIQLGLTLSALYLALMVYLSAPLSVIAVIATGMVSLLTRGIVKRSRKQSRRLVRAGSEYGKNLHERVAAIRLMKMRGCEDAEVERLRRVLDRLEVIQVRLQTWSGSVQVITDPAMMLAVFTIVFIAVELLGMQLSSLGLFLFVLLRMANTAKKLNMDRQALAANVESLVRLTEVTAQAEKASAIAGGSRTFAGLRKRVEFRDVSFAYHSGGAQKLVLRDVTFSLEHGTLTAIVGSSGAGKSTLVDLIPRLRERSGGKILFDGVPIEEFELTSLRKKIGFLTQEAMLFDESVRYNLTYGLDREPSDEEIFDALERAYAKSIVDGLPEGLDTKVGERGGRLSGGERQRLSLARELLLDPDILILDEPTSALDSESEAYIKASLDRLHGDKTLVVIAHRLSTVLSADQILVLESGRIVERGRHHDLIEAGGRYSELFKSQIISVESGSA